MDRIAPDSLPRTLTPNNGSSLLKPFHGASPARARLLLFAFSSLLAFFHFFRALHKAGLDEFRCIFRDTVNPNLSRISKRPVLHSAIYWRLCWDVS
jgi:hypothetical protein